MSTPQRIRINADAPPGMPILRPDGAVLGEFVPGLGYRITPENADCVQQLLADGHATLVDPIGPGGTAITSSEAIAEGLIKT